MGGDGKEHQQPDQKSAFGCKWQPGDQHDEQKAQSVQKQATHQPGHHLGALAEKVAGGNGDEQGHQRGQGREQPDFGV